MEASSIRSTLSFCTVIDVEQRFEYYSEIVQRIWRFCFLVYEYYNVTIVWLIGAVVR
jgi:hypothetical protein